MADDDTMHRLLLAYSASLELLADRLRDAGAPVPELRRWKLRSCGHWLARELELETPCTSCASSNRDRREWTADRLRG